MNKGYVGLVSLGCDKNRVDSEIVLHHLTERGFLITDDPKTADVLIVNTCAFLETARKESIETVLEMARYKQYRCKCLVVCGCLGQKFGEEVFSAMPEVDCILGTNDYDRIADIVETSLASKGHRVKNISPCDAIAEGGRVLTTPSHYAYLKIADGCDNFCSYCLIPYIRGRYRSRTMESIFSEAQTLAQNGVKELILVAQDVTKYGFDLCGAYKITELVRRLSEIEGIHWIRLLYCYPELVDDALLNEVDSNEKVVKYIDVPLQHVDDFMLRKMNRKSTEQDIVALFDKLSARGIAVRSAFICGFPYETEKTHRKVVRFLQNYKLRNAGFFPYSREEGTAAAKFPQQKQTRTKDRMTEHLYAVQQAIAADNNEADVGKTLECVIDGLVERTSDGYVYTGRTEFMSPQIDGVVYVHSRLPLNIGHFYLVCITDAAEYDLIGDVYEPTE